MDRTELKTMKGGAVLALTIETLRDKAASLRFRQEASVKAGIISEWSPSATEEYAAAQAAAAVLEGIVAGGPTKMAATLADICRSALIIELLPPAKPRKWEASDASAA